MEYLFFTFLEDLLYLLDNFNKPMAKSKLVFVERDLFSYNNKAFLHAIVFIL